MSGTILEMKNISKEFTGVKALSNVNFKVEKGEIHCLVGENGAGKSTLMKVLSGVYPYGEYDGDIIFENQVQKFSKISDSVDTGVVIIYQELALFPDLTIYENIFAGNELHRKGVVDWNEAVTRSKELLDKVNLHINPETLIKDISIGKQQLVEIAKALSKRVKLLILDEPTAALNDTDSENLLSLLRELKKQGITSIMISHKLNEVISIADKATVLRDGKTICTLDGAKGEITEGAIIKNMVGRAIEDIYPKRKVPAKGDKLLELTNWTAHDPRIGRNVAEDINLHVNYGEIVGIAGLMGAGRTELALSIFGNSKKYKTDGTIKVDGKPVKLAHTSDAIKTGIAYVTEDRKGDGLFLLQDIKNNISISNLKELSTYGVVNQNEEIRTAEKYRISLGIKTPSIQQKTGNLSGGNQQKVSLGKWLFVNPKLLILDEPTRGIDVGAKLEIYTVMNKLIESGMSIIMISSELGEVLGMSDRVYVMAKGRIRGELSATDANQEKIMELATQ
ncbi:sugar ABC transporter ATP-binding protein [Jeotgalibacillus proteolyticus]|uniref:ABC transporter ATP-binding protein n=1 Tax=Jeotgalibacillus proteolyticus TaxID=2082395 RepID=A0A2S5G8M9_9BACL|nr:sugar ABC transporter ATP-binding protein [Jeotgalibacillus proteolyticus]PPA69362.1 ABC transporter ATP-binding protein [Jeotgalibacillus proteolyticus]